MDILELVENFYNSFKGEKGVIGKSVETIGSNAFSYCSSLTGVEIGESVKWISSYAFYRCTSLEDVVMGKSVISIGKEAFAYCSLKTIKCRGSAADWANITKGTSWDSVTGSYTVTYNYDGE